jgi:GTP-binding protein EngB required for normal cell division
MSPKPLQTDNATVVFLGKLGHGKTHLLNKLCGESFKSVMCAESCTRQNQRGSTLQHGITIIDTPGFGSSDDTGSHIREQRSAIEDTRISGIYAIVKYGSTSDMAANLYPLMDFASVEDVRIIVTHVDTCPDQSDGFDRSAVVEDLSRLLDIEANHIFFSRKETAGREIEEFLRSTLHKPRRFTMETEQVAYASSLTVGARQFNVDVEQAASKLDHAELVLKNLIQCLQNQAQRSDNVALAIEATNAAAKHMVKSTRSGILSRANELVPEQRRAVEEKIDQTLVVRLEAIRKPTIFPGLQVQALERPRKKQRQGSGREISPHALTASFVTEPSSSGWRLRYHWKGAEIDLTEFLALDLAPADIPASLRHKRRERERGRQKSHEKTTGTAWRETASSTASVHEAQSRSKNHSGLDELDLEAQDDSGYVENHSRAGHRAASASSSLGEGETERLCQGKMMTHGRKKTPLLIEDNDSHDDNTSHDPRGSRYPSGCFGMLCLCGFGALIFMVVRRRRS